MEANQSKLFRIGTCSWKYDSWKGLVYSEQVNNYLSEYARQYSVVEVDQWFWSLFGDTIVLPRADVVAEYSQSVPAGFKFCIKVPNAITLTHHYGSSKTHANLANPNFLSKSLFLDFLDALSPMHHQIESLIFQFEYLNKTKMKNQTEFLNHLDRFFESCPGQFRYAAEVRNQNYLNGEYFYFLQARGLSHVFLQGYWMPPVFGVYQRYKQFIESHAVIRLLGPDRKGIENKTHKKWNQVVEPRDKELELLKIMVDEMVDKGLQITINVNNHYEGAAPETITRFLRLFESA